MSDFNFILPGGYPDMMREMVCSTCARNFIWYIHTITSNCVVGGEQPTTCPYCGGKEVKVRYS